MSTSFVADYLTRNLTFKEQGTGYRNAKDRLGSIGWKAKCMKEKLGLIKTVKFERD